MSRATHGHVGVPVRRGLGHVGALRGPPGLLLRVPEAHVSGWCFGTLALDTRTQHQREVSILRGPRGTRSVSRSPREPPACRSCESRGSGCQSPLVRPAPQHTPHARHISMVKNPSVRNRDEFYLQTFYTNIETIFLLHTKFILKATGKKRKKIMYL